MAPSENLPPGEVAPAEPALEQPFKHAAGSLGGGQ